jgi:hypothetical protein
VRTFINEEGDGSGEKLVTPQLKVSPPREFWIDSGLLHMSRNEKNAYSGHFVSLLLHIH